MPGFFSGYIGKEQINDTFFSDTANCKYVAKTECAMSIFNVLNENRRIYQWNIRDYFHQ